MEELDAAVVGGFMSEALFFAELHRRKSDDLASPWERAREGLVA